MGQMLVRQLDDAKLEQLKRRARELHTSLEALAHDASHRAAELTAEEKLALVHRLQAWSEDAKVAGVVQTAGVDLIREDRDR